MVEGESWDYPITDVVKGRPCFPTLHVETSKEEGDPVRPLVSLYVMGKEGKRPTAVPGPGVSDPDPRWDQVCEVRCTGVY